MFERAGVYLRRDLGVAVSLVDPQVVVIGGGMASALPLYQEAMLKSLRESLPEEVPLPEVVVTPLGYNAAAIDAAASFWINRKC